MRRAGDQTEPAFRLPSPGGATSPDFKLPRFCAERGENFRIRPLARARPTSLAPREKSAHDLRRAPRPDAIELANLLPEILRSPALSFVDCTLIATARNSLSISSRHRAHEPSGLALSHATDTSSARVSHSNCLRAAPLPGYLQMGDNIAGDIDMAAPTKVEPEAEPAQDRTPSSIESTPEAEEQPQPSQEQPQQPPKRKGGRKPVCKITSQSSRYSS